MAVSTMEMKTITKPEGLGVTTPELPKFEAIRKSLGVTQIELHRLAGLSVRTISELESGRKAPSQAELRRARELSRLRKELGQIMKPASIGDWLRSPNPSFKGASPIDLVQKGEVDRIWRLIWRLQDGATA